MMHPRYAPLGALVALLTASVAGGQVVAGQERADDWTVPRTVDGHADLQGVWSNNGATPLERPEIFGDRTELTEEEVAQIQLRADQLVNGVEDAGATVFGDYLFRQAVDDPSLQLFDTETGNYNAFWIADRTFDDMRTSLIIDPPNGRIPPMTEAAMTRLRASYGGAFRRSGDDVTERPMPHVRRPESHDRVQQLLPDRANADPRRDSSGAHPRCPRDPAGRTTGPG